MRGSHKLLAHPRLAVFLVAAELDVTMLSDASVPDQPEDVREGISRAFSPAPPAVTPSGQPNQKDARCGAGRASLLPSQETSGLILLLPKHRVSKSYLVFTPLCQSAKSNKWLMHVKGSHGNRDEFLQVGVRGITGRGGAHKLRSCTS